MTAISNRRALSCATRLTVAAAAMLAAVHGASADDAGLHAFFSSMFGGPSRDAPAPVAVEPTGGYAAPVAQRAYRSRALTVRLHPAKPRVLVVEAPTKPQAVSIFEDRTLRRGDAVMTAQGVRIFAGSNSWPYSPKDFVMLGNARDLNTDTSKVLAQIDKLPRG